MSTTDLDHRSPLPDHAAHADVAPPTMVDLIDAAITSADHQRAELAEAGDLDALAHGLHAARQIRQRLGLLIDLIDADVSRLNLARPRGELAIIDGLGTLETKRRSTRTRWDSDLLFGVLIDHICGAALDPDTGERIGDRLRDALAAALPLTASMGWRVGGLKAAGIDPDQYREREHGPHTTRIINSEGVSR